MCGRFTLTVSGKLLGELFGMPAPEELQPRYNIAPTQPHPIVCGDEASARRWQEARWGLVPSWSKDAKGAARLINARSESAASKPAFRSAVKKRRCLVPADGFYEWQKQGSGKQPYHFHFADRRPFAFAGLWEIWKAEDEPPLTSFTIMTTRANALVEPIHERMPVILAPSAFAEWLDSAPLRAERLAELALPHPPEEMACHPVNPRVGSVQNDDPDCMAPMEQLSLW